MAKRQIVLTSGSDDNGDASLGTLREVMAALAAFNTAPDGSVRTGAATAILYGPGMVVEAPTTADEIRQALVTLVEEDIAWPVLTRLCKARSWKMMDVQTGRSFG